eukprot:3469508-Prymnesium_polylepis.1
MQFQTLKLCLHRGATHRPTPRPSHRTRSRSVATDAAEAEGPHRLDYRPERRHRCPREPLGQRQGPTEWL